MKAIIGFILLLVVLSGSIFTGEGMSALRPFLMAETMLATVLGTAVILVFTFPLKIIMESYRSLSGGIAESDNEMRNRVCELFHAAAHIGSSVGVIVALYGIILVLINIADMSRLPIRLAFALTALFYGFLISICFSAFERYIKYHRVS